MKIHNGSLSDVSRFIESGQTVGLNARRRDYESYFQMIRRFVEITPETKLLEIGTGTGWFPLLCKLDGFSCKGLEISPQLIEHAMSIGREYGVVPDIELGNIEETNIAPGSFDAIIANSVFEHVEKWRQGLARVFQALRPGGVFFFISTNKFCPISSEYHFPLYGWLPDKWRYRLRVARQGPDIMKLGIDFNQFTHPQLRRAFRELGFSQILDRLEVADPRQITKPWKSWILRASRSNPMLKPLVLTFCDATIFVCIK
jgi:2-polyprenyl-3-methyl-5-hydroxy-6-metoxy-1,4-benzoquinol methylase